MAVCGRLMGLPGRGHQVFNVLGVPRALYSECVPEIARLCGCVSVGMGHRLIGDYPREQGSLRTAEKVRKLEGPGCSGEWWAALVEDYR